MDNEIMNQEVIETEDLTVPNEELEVEETYEPSLGESIATLAVLLVPLAVTYAAGVASGDRVKAGISKAKNKINTFFENRKNKKKLVNDSVEADFVEVDETEE